MQTVLGQKKWSQEMNECKICKTQWSADGLPCPRCQDDRPAEKIKQLAEDAVTDAGLSDSQDEGGGESEEQIAYRFFLEGARAMAELLAVREGEHGPRLEISLFNYKNGTNGFVTSARTPETLAPFDHQEYCPVTELQQATARFEAEREGLRLELESARDKQKRLIAMKDAERARSAALVLTNLPQPR